MSVEREDSCSLLILNLKYKFRSLPVLSTRTEQGSSVLIETNRKLTSISWGLEIPNSNDWVLIGKLRYLCKILEPRCYNNARLIWEILRISRRVTTGYGIYDWLKCLSIGEATKCKHVCLNIVGGNVYRLSKRLIKDLSNYWMECTFSSRISFVTLFPIFISRHTN